MTPNSCDGCGLRDVWGPTWSWWGSILQWEGEAKGRPLIACSEACSDKVFPKGYRQHEIKEETK